MFYSEAEGHGLPCYKICHDTITGFSSHLRRIQIPPISGDIMGLEMSIPNCHQSGGSVVEHDIADLWRGEEWVGSVGGMGSGWVRSKE